jgi:hypothetical protein
VLINELIATGSEGAPDDVDPVSFDDVVRLDVIKVGNLDATLEVLRHLLDVVLKSFEGLDRAFVDFATFPDQPDLGRPLDGALKTWRTTARPK